MTDPSPAPRVFLSYSHDSAEHAQRVLALADQLRREGIDAWIDQYDRPTNWQRWMVDQIEQADRVLAICTATYRKRFEGHETEGGQGADFEGAILTGDLYRREHDKVLPIVFGDGKDVVPTVLREVTRYDLDTPDGYEALYRLLTDQPAITAPDVGPRRRLPSRAPQKRVSTFGLVSVRTSTPEPEDSPDVETYQTWASANYGHLDLVGLGAGDLRVGLDEIYVPLRLGTDRDLRAAEMYDIDGGKGASLDKPQRRGFTGPEIVELDRVFLHGPSLDTESRHVLIFGEPGSGKTTALRKLHQLAFDPGAEALGLAPGTLPVFLRLRRFSPDRLVGSLADLIEAEIQDIAGGRVPEGIGATLWSRGRLLLLFDGLDEIADEAHRAKVLERVAWFLRESDAVDMRAVVSTRPAGWTDSVQAIRLDSFQRADVRPFDDAQVRALVELWFREVKRLGQLSDAVANERSSTLANALHEERNQQIQVLVSTPMLLTLLCVVVMRGGEIPRRRVDFYEECLKVLLGRWRQHQAGRKAPVDPEQALQLAGELAWYLHSQNRRDDLVFVQAVRTLLEPVGDRDLAVRLVHWFHRDAGILDRYTEANYGFTHLGLQEHLTARHLADQPTLLDELEPEWWDDSWWEEVVQLLAALSGGRGFAPLIDHLLQTDAVHRRADLIVACCRDATSIDWTPFRTALDSGDADQQIAVLRLLRAVGSAERLMNAKLLETVRKLSDGGSEVVRSAAGLLLAQAKGAADDASTVFLLHGHEDAEPAARLADQLGKRGFSTEQPGDRHWQSGACCTRMMEASVVVVLAGNTSWDRSILADAVYLCRKVVTVLLPGEPRPDAPVDDHNVFDLVTPDGAAFERLVEHLHDDGVEQVTEPMRSVEPFAIDLGTSKTTVAILPTPPVEGEPYREPITDETFLWVPGGRFQMGGTAYDDEQPIHWVRLSPFWMARTPVTNRQFALFLEANLEAKEPGLWRDRRFSDPSQPVVAVSWHDAVAYCEWLTARSDHALEFKLPSEAQWEFSARGEAGREYPWGGEKPDASRACFGKDREKGKPSAVGSYAAGMGPFGHLDLAGNVWEWCIDRWEPSYDWLAKGEPVDPVGETNDGLRPLRGGSWWSSAEYLRSAYRHRRRPGIRGDNVGFRVVCAPAI